MGEVPIYNLDSYEMFFSEEGAKKEAGNYKGGPILNQRNLRLMLGYDRWYSGSNTNGYHPLSESPSNLKTDFQFQKECFSCECKDELT